MKLLSGFISVSILLAGFSAFAEPTVPEAIEKIVKFIKHEDANGRSLLHIKRSYESNDCEMESNVFTKDRSSLEGYLMSVVNNADKAATFILDNKSEITELSENGGRSLKIVAKHSVLKKSFSLTLENYGFLALEIDDGHRSIRCTNLKFK
ncbi:MAG: hypothetical protein AB7O96_03095 [Pseudobdellovibrionaceae bacterium]